MTRPGNILIAAGGTGGHIAPALAVGAAVRAVHGDRVEVFYACGSRPGELEFYAMAGVDPLVLALPAAFSPRDPRGVLRLGGAVLSAVRMLRSRDVGRVMGMGGYVCAPVLTAARLLGIPYFLHESNAYPGRLVRVFSRWASGTLLGQAAAARHLRCRVQPLVVGTPVRFEDHLPTREAAASELGLDPSRRTVVVLGGSQGARGINRAVGAALDTLLARGVQVVWSTGNADHDAAFEAAAGRPGVIVHPTIHPVSRAYAAADLVVSRAGAGTLAEVALCGLPSILIPYPHAMDDHQTANARGFEEAGAAVVLPEAGLDGPLLARAVLDVLDEPERQAGMRQACRALGQPGAARRIARLLLGQEEPAPGLLPIQQAEAVAGPCT